MVQKIETAETERPREDAIDHCPRLHFGPIGPLITRSPKKLFRNISRDYEIMSYLCVIILCDYEVLCDCG